jgi:hypothetical protein
MVYFDIYKLSGSMVNGKKHSKLVKVIGKIKNGPSLVLDPPPGPLP